jgi:hypothetical protein
MNRVNDKTLNSVPNIKSVPIILFMENWFGNGGTTPELDF